MFELLRLVFGLVGCVVTLVAVMVVLLFLGFAIYFWFNGDMSMAPETSTLTKLFRKCYHRIGDPKICHICTGCGGRNVVVQKGFGRWRKVIWICGCKPKKW